MPSTETPVSAISQIKLISKAKGFSTENDVNCGFKYLCRQFGSVPNQH